MNKLDPFTLPDFQECEYEVSREKSTALEEFIYQYSPEMKECKAWRAKLQMAIQCVLMDFIERSVTEGTPDLSVIWRDDGVRFYMNRDGTYSMEKLPIEKTGEEPPIKYKYKLRRLLESGQFTFWPPLTSGKNLYEKGNSHQ